jgi:hypothetical protein
MQLKEELQRRVESLKVELESARKRAAQARAEEEMLSKDLAAFQGSLEAEMRRNGHVGSISATIADSSPKPEAALVDSESAPEINKAQLMRQLIVENRGIGSTASTILEGLKRKGAECPPTYVYSALSRMKAGGLIHKRRGKFFPSEALLGTETAKQTASE